MTSETIRSRRVVQGIILLILLAGVFLRIKFYGDPRLSVASHDTKSYVASAQVPLNSWDIFSGKRLFTTNLLYKFFEPEDGYRIIANGSGNTTRRAFQPGFDHITSLQFVMSILCWCFLALTLSKHLKLPLLRIFGAAVILAFAFTPQMADWDSVLMSESLTFSLFALQFALLIRVVFVSETRTETSLAPLLSGWIIVYFIWTFMRDTNLYAVPATIALFVVLWSSMGVQKGRIFGILIAILTGILVLGWITSHNSIRSTFEINHVYNSDILPYPSRVEVFESMGMPAPDSPEYQTWFEAHSVNTFIKFVITHPGYVASKLGKDILQAFGENIQTYFKIPELGVWREHLIQFGNAMHPKSATPFFISGILLVVLLYYGWKNLTGNSRPWTWIGVWLFIVAGLTMSVAIVVGVDGLFRHTLFSTMAYRLFMWIFLIIVLDLGLDRDMIGSPPSADSMIPHASQT